METHRRPGARRLEEIRRGTLHPPRRPLTVFDDARATAVAATRAEAPELVAEVGRLRSLAFADEVEATGECYGLDEYDDLLAPRRDRQDERRRRGRDAPGVRA